MQFSKRVFYVSMIILMVVVWPISAAALTTIDTELVDKVIEKKFKKICGQVLSDKLENVMEVETAGISQKLLIKNLGTELCKGDSSNFAKKLKAKATFTLLVWLNAKTISDSKARRILYVTKANAKLSNKYREDASLIQMLNLVDPSSNFMKNLTAQVESAGHVTKIDQLNNLKEQLVVINDDLDLSWLEVEQMLTKATFQGNTVYSNVEAIFNSRQYVTLDAGVSDFLIHDRVLLVKNKNLPPNKTEHFWPETCPKGQKNCVFKNVVFDDLFQKDLLLPSGSNIYISTANLKKYLKQQGAAKIDINRGMKFFILSLIEQDYFEACNKKCTIIAGEITGLLSAGNGSIDHTKLKAFLQTHLGLHADNVTAFQALSSKLPAHQKKICGTDKSFCAALVKVFIESVELNATKTKFQFQSGKLALASLKTALQDQKLIQAACAKNEAHATYCQTLIYTLIDLGQSPMASADMQAFGTSMVLNYPGFTSETVKFLEALSTGDRDEAKKLVLNYIKKEKPFTKYCLAHPKTCQVEEPNAIIGCRDTKILVSSTEDFVWDEHLSGCNNDLGRFAMGQVFAMLDDLPNYTSYEAPVIPATEGKFVFDQKGFAEVNIPRMKRITTYQNYSLYLGIGKSVVDIDSTYFGCTPPSDCESTTQTLYHGKIGFRYDLKDMPECLKWLDQGNSSSPMYWATYFGGVLFENSSPNASFQEYLSKRAIFGNEIGINLYETIDISVGTHTYFKPGYAVTGKPHPYFSVSISLWDYFSEM